MIFNEDNFKKNQVTIIATKLKTLFIKLDFKSFFFFPKALVE